MSDHDRQAVGQNGFRARVSVGTTAEPLPTMI